MRNAMRRKWQWRFLTTVFFGLLFAMVFVLPAEAHAADYETVQVSLPGSGSLTMQPGERKEVVATFQNTGRTTWHNYGSGYISIYTYGPKYRHSVFDPGTWMGPTQLKPMTQRDVAPGGQASVAFELRAPSDPGVYTETFHLAAEDRAWVSGGEFTLTIRVEESGTPDSSDPVVKEPSAADGYDADLTFVTANKVRLEAGRSALLSAVFTNTGETTWSEYALVAPDVTLSSEHVSFAHPSWDGGRLAIGSGPIAPGEKAVVSFSLRAPEVNGVHTAAFSLQVDGTNLNEARVEIPVEVTGGSEAIAQAPIKKELKEGVQNAQVMVEEPNMRVGVLIVDEETGNEVHITSHESDFTLKDINGNILAELQKDQVVQSWYKDYRYYFNAGRGVEQSSYALRFEPNQAGAVMSVENFDRRLTRGSAHKDNTFRGVLELRWNDYKDRTWLINEVPMEYYLRGLAETSEAHPEEMNKAQILAARTYAYFHHTRNGKRQEEFMDLNSTPSDQLYQGYGRESRAPGIVRAVEETFGQIVTYAGEVAITPYFARSNGHTKDWSEVWWGDQPHVKGVSVPCDVGKSQWGHGVGMPQSGANCLAEEGKTYEEILKYFFTGIEILKKWN